MKNIITFNSFNESVIPLQEDYWDEPDDPREEEPSEPEIDYPEGEQLFNLVADVPYLCLTLLKGKPAVGGGIWILAHDCGVPNSYLYSYYYDDNVKYEDKIAPGTYENWATDIWKEEKDKIGEGVRDFYTEGPPPPGGWKESDFKLLIKVDPELRERLIEDLDESLSLKYDKGSSPSGEVTYIPHRRNLNSRDREEIKKALFFLERYPG